MTAPSGPEIVLREQALESTELRRAQRAFSPAKPGQRPLAPPRTAYGNSTSPGSPPDLGAPICNFHYADSAFMPIRAFWAWRYRCSQLMLSA
jgi:hypothetical protein